MRHLFVHVVFRRQKVGETYLDLQDIAYDTTWDLWHNIAALAAMTVAFLCIAYILLRRVKKYK